VATHESFKPAVSPILVGTVFVYLLVLALYLHLHDDAARPLDYSPGGLQNVAQTMGPLVAIAAFIERAVEIVIATWRGPRTLAYERALEAAGPLEKDAVQRALDRYKLETQRCSLGIALTIAMAASLVGVRAVSPLLAPSPAELRWFDVFDVALTSLLLAGGSDGIHQVVTTVTTFLEKSRKPSPE
jgi:hypothetical protein